MSVTTDGRQIVMPSLFPAGVFLSFAGAGDDANLGRGQGPAFAITTYVAGTKQVTFSFNDMVYLAGGWCTWDNGTLGDKISFAVTAPATTYTSAIVTAAVGSTPAIGTGNANLNATNGMITPAASNGLITVTNPVPLPYTASAGQGPWIWCPSTYNAANPWTPDMNNQPSPLTGLGQVVPTPTGTQYDTVNNWTYMLANAPQNIATFVNNVNTVGSRQVDMTLGEIKPQMLLPQWNITATVVCGSTRAATNPLLVTWVLKLARYAT